MLLERIADEARLVVADADLEIRRQGRLDLFELGQDAVDDVDGIGARLLSDLQADRRLAVDLVGLRGSPGRRPGRGRCRRT